MPLKNGELTTSEIRKLIRAHNILVSIKIPKGSKRDDIIKLVQKNGYKIDHVKQSLVPVVQMQRKKTIGLKKAKELTKPKPIKQKTELQKQKEVEKKDEEINENKKKERNIRKKAVDDERSRKKEDREKLSKDKLIKDNTNKNTTKMKGKENKVIDFYGKSDKKFKDPPVTKQPEKKDEIDFKIGDTYLFKKNNEFVGILARINAKSVTMIERVGSTYENNLIQKEDVIKRLGGTNYDKVLGEYYTKVVLKKPKKKPKKKVVKSDSEKLKKLYIEMEKLREEQKINKSVRKKAPIMKKIRELQKLIDAEKLSKVVKSDSERITELWKKLGYKNLPYPAQITNISSDKLNKLEEKQTALEESGRGKSLKEKISIMKEVNKAKKEKDKEQARLNTPPKKLSKDEQELLELINNMNMD
tara:strand:- start:385 stop:1629 length:1245 start_codon:yes stop_codon:yes gene_type:complete